MSRHLLPLAMGLALGAGCGRQEPSPPVTASEVKGKAADAADAAAAYARQEKDQYVARAQKAVDEGRAEIDRLEAQARSGSAAARRKLERRIEAMEARWSVAERRLSQLRS
ncbi:MAG TPA: hypothetical protein VEP68_02995, partial [Anaeromyxobacteraceae bacterium]|nr:hypothetical protein [Anaeromyxobacteraceae bacterium]